MTPTEQIDTKEQELRKLAEAATQEEWKMIDQGGSIGLRVHSGYQCFFNVQKPNAEVEAEARANAAFIERCSPPAILALLDERDEWRERALRAERRLSQFPNSENAERAEAAAGAVPTGFKLVPVEPTPAMIEAYTNTLNTGFAGSPAHGSHVWEAMLDAAPAAAPSAPVAAPRALVTPMAGSLCGQCGQLGTHLCAASAAPVAAQAEPVAPCAQQMRQQGLAAPRTCPTCKLGPCRFERATPPAPMQEAGKDALIQQLQRALAFWLPSVPAEPKDVSERAGDDAMLLRGYDGKSERSAEELEWLRLDYTARYRHIRNLRVEQTNQPGQPGIAVPTTHNSGHFVTEEDADRVIDESIASTPAIATSKEEACAIAHSGRTES